VTTTEQPIVVTEAGVYDGMPEDVYHGDPVPEGSLSSTGARRLLPPSCPAIFRHEQLNGRANKREFDFGHAAHAKVLGVGSEVVSVDAKDWRTNAAKEARDAAYADGKVPLLAKEISVVDEMAEALLRHPVASALFNPERGGLPEQSLFWQDERHEVWRRVRLDWLPATSSGRMILADYKTTTCAEPKAFAKSVFSLGYHVQAAFYLDAVTALELADDAALVFVAQEKTPPYLVTVNELDFDALRIGRAQVQRALTIFARCQRSGAWPGYSDDVEVIRPPAWLVREFEDGLL
jgi:hypothetical protein